ncbi:MAG: LptF/LptG family permease [Tepidisphaeraceae bacterium]|jgi:lipopolysaccharide export LptBFGC system permease protein LptF
MSKTLFWYIFRDLLKVFFLTLGVLAGIISFGGLLKPLMQYGLTSGQVLKMLAYFMPAAQTYALPIAALFATTVVYGRLSADNEITACRATGISFPVLTIPAFIMGLVLALVALASLCFVVPHYTLKVEKVAFSSLADILVRSIEREHRVKLPAATVYADSAWRMPAPPDKPDDEVVVLKNPMFCFYELTNEPDPLSGGTTPVAIPSDFYAARSATVVIHRGDAGLEFFANLDDGSMFPRNLTGASVASVEAASVGPLPLPSPIKENPKFMTIRQLQKFYEDPLGHRDVRALYNTITMGEEQLAYQALVLKEFAARRQLHFDSGTDEGYTVVFQKGIRAPFRGIDRLSWFSPGETRDIRLLHTREGIVTGTDDARNLTLKFQSDLSTQRMRIVFQLDDVLIGTDEIRPARASVPRFITTPLPAELKEISARPPAYYLTNVGKSGESWRLKRKLQQLQTSIHAEIHARASFAVSCFILVMVGAAMGMMFKAGNFLSAFAISVVPAFLCIALMVTGQHVAEGDSRNLGMGLGIIWSGNAIVGTLAAGLLVWLRKQ